MLKILPFILTFIIATASLQAAPNNTNRSEEASALQDRINQRVRQIAAMDAYSARLLHLLDLAGFPSRDLIRKQTVEQKMDRILPQFRCDGVRFVDAIRALSGAADVEISVDWKSLTEAGISGDAPIRCEVRDRPIHDALQKILDAAGGDTTSLSFLVEEGKVNVTTQKQASKNTVTKSYNVAAILHNYRPASDAPEILGKLIEDTVAPDSWLDVGGTAGSLRIDSREMTITQTPDNLASIERLFEQLDINKQIAHSRAEIDQQQIEIVALNAEIGRLVARCRSLGIPIPPRGATDAELDNVIVTRVYDVRDVPMERRPSRGEMMEEFIRSLMANIDPDSWRDAGGTIGSIRELQGMLIVTHNERAQARIKAYLNLLRRQYKAEHAQ